MQEDPLHVHMSRVAVDPGLLVIVGRLVRFGRHHLVGFLVVRRVVAEGHFGVAVHELGQVTDVGWRWDAAVGVPVAAAVLCR